MVNAPVMRRKLLIVSKIDHCQLSVNEVPFVVRHVKKFRTIFLEAIIDGDSFQKMERIPKGEQRHNKQVKTIRARPKVGVRRAQNTQRTELILICENVFLKF